MRITNNTLFPHPVLRQHTNDFNTGNFIVNFTVSEDTKTGSLSLRHDISLTEPDIQKLVITGKAAVGCYIKCKDTYYTELHELSWHEGRLDFPAGSLLNRVTIHPIVWLRDKLPNWNPANVHREFDLPLTLPSGTIIAIDEEVKISVGQAKLAPIESIFKLERSPDLPEGKIQVDLDQDHITILVGSKTYDNILLLKEKNDGQHILMNALYLPAVMEVIDCLRSNNKNYESFRWHRPFTAKCDATGIEINNGTSILEAAQTLLKTPFLRLNCFLERKE